MPGARCSAPNCSVKHSDGFSLFRYPRDQELRKEWLDAIGRPNWTPTKEARLCELHFSLLHIDKKTSRLKENTVPLHRARIVCICNGKMHSITYNNINIQHDHTYISRLLPDPHCQIHRPRTTSQEEVDSILTENCKLMKEVSRLNKIIESKENVTPKRRELTKEEIRRGLQLRFSCGSSGYRKLRELQQHISPSPIPSIRSLQIATAHIKFAPGILKEVLEPLSVKFKGFSDDRDLDINLVFDELVFKRRVDYDASLKRFIGFGTLPGQEQELAEKGEIYVFRGIHQRLKQIVCYHLNPSQGNPESKKQVILELLTKARDMNANVVSLVCDMGNRPMMSALGFCTRKDSMKCCIENPVNPGKKLWCVPDPVHVFKSMKEGLCTNRSIELPASIVAEYELPSAFVNLAHIEWLEGFQRDDTLQLVPGLTLKDLSSTHFTKMKVKSSLKVVHPRMAAALQYLVVKGLVPEEFETTAWFLKLMNRWFQLMTSRNLQCALGLKNQEAYEEAIRHIQLVIYVFKFMKVEGGWKPWQTHTIFASEAILEIQEYLLHEKKYEFVQTGTFTTDVVENINSCIRINTPNPTPLEFKNRLKQLAIAQFQMKIKSSSYDFDETEDFIDLLLTPDKAASSSTPEVDLSNLKWIPNVPANNKKPHEDDVLYRICGYIVISLMKKRMLTCEGCIKSLRHSEETLHPHGLFLELTNFVPGAQFPVVDSVFQLCRLIEYNLMKWVGRLQLLERLDYVIDSLVQPGTKHFELGTCHNVKEKLVKSFTVMRFKQIAVTHFSPH